ncbi:MAG: thioredoxin-disulfide reductase [Elusimicrobia bacterium RIFOXYA2_FULL_39_19]|nr:MAG: thioredoxin-disulfide reductase [Elusimicrobia bacterium RIFOXYA2_FULL_39_19]
MNTNYDIIIIGAGPAGLTAAIYACRARLNTLLIEKASVGGQVIITEKIENYPGFPEGINGFELIENMRKQAESFGMVTVADEISAITVNGSTKTITASSGNTYNTKAIVITTGANFRKLNIPGEIELTGKGVSYCATCDGPFFRNKDVVVIGGGDSAIEEAIFLTRFAKKVTVIHRRAELRAAKILQERMFSNPKIVFIGDTVPLSITGTQKVESIKVKNVKTNTEQTLETSGVFIFVGTDPNTAFLKNTLTLDEQGYIITDENLQTSAEGIFAAGDCRKKPFRQVITACGEGATAVFSAEKYVENHSA